MIIYLIYLFINIVFLIYVISCIILINLKLFYKLFKTNNLSSNHSFLILNIYIYITSKFNLNDFPDKK